jgi:hypothetical protein
MGENIGCFNFTIYETVYRVTKENYYQWRTNTFIKKNVKICLF